ncbi:MAG TPA: RluA family pseudouridine synthase [Thermoanaerobaculia bacterium]|nr:RluA family pseudouridine synthase [Thermoanaerobaculia bacterium]
MPDGAHTVQGEQAGLTLAALVRELAPGTSWSQARDLCRGGRVWVNGEAAADPARRLAGGERVEVRSAAPRSPASSELIVHLDADVAVVRKPAGILTVPFERDDRDTLLALARVAIRRMDSARKSEPNPTLRAVQRLDKDTSGLVVFARSIKAQRHLQEQLAGHTVLRRYLAIAHGKVENGTHESLLIPDRGDGLRGSWKGRGSPPATAKQAVTYVRMEKRLRGATLAECELETGRQHQIRIHLAEAGHPLVGETVYIRDYRGPFLPAPRPMLHAAVLGFLHPRGEKPMEFEDPAPGDFTEVLERLKP